jgi:hypothetical protein
LRGVGESYLANQGVMFDISTSNGGGGFGFSDMFDGGRDGAPRAPVPAKPVVFKDGWVELNLNEDELEVYVEDAMHQSWDRLRELGEQQREIAWEQREYQRCKRDLEFEKAQCTKEQTQRHR